VKTLGMAPSRSFGYFAFPEVFKYSTASLPEDNSIETLSRILPRLLVA